MHRVLLTVRAGARLKQRSDGTFALGQRTLHPKIAQGLLDRGLIEADPEENHLGWIARPYRLTRAAHDYLDSARRTP